MNNDLSVLLAMAHDRSERGRLALADRLAHVFLAQDLALAPHEERLVHELIEDLLKNEDPSVRHALIARFAREETAPRPVALRIVKGPADIAAPVLASNQNLFDDDLISIIEDKGSSHAAAIARRKQISEAVADALVTTGDPEVMKLVAENLGAKLSARAMDVLVNAARLTAMLQKPILDRPELSAGAAARLYWWVARDLRRATLERFGFGPGKLDAELKEAVGRKLDDSLLSKDDPTAMESLADWLQERDSVRPEILPRLLRIGHYRLFNVLLGRLTDLKTSLVDDVMNAPSGRLMVVLCRAVKIDKGNFVSIFLMSRGGRSGEQIVRPRELSEALETFDKIKPERAETLLKGWRANPRILLGLIRREERAARQGSALL